MEGPTYDQMFTHLGIILAVMASMVALLVLIDTGVVSAEQTA
jgi:preprotein translocase subunit SecE